MLLLLSSDKCKRQCYGDPSNMLAHNSGVTAMI